MKKITETAMAVIFNELGQVLCVSRKDDWTKFGLPGGKWEEIDATIEDTCIREIKEETGLDIYDLELVFTREENRFKGYTFICKWKGEINHNEPHLVKWGSFDDLIKGPFGKYNAELENVLIKKYFDKKK